MKAATRYVFCRTVKFFDVHQMQYLTSSDGESNPVRYVLLLCFGLAKWSILVLVLCFGDR